MVGISSKADEICGAAPILSPDETVIVAGFFTRSAANEEARTAAPMLVADASSAPWKSLNCKN